MASLVDKGKPRGFDRDTTGDEKDDGAPAAKKQVASRVEETTGITGSHLGGSIRVSVLHVDARGSWVDNLE